jgi:hypothetical protein
LTIGRRGSVIPAIQHEHSGGIPQASQLLQASVRCYFSGQEGATQTGDAGVTGNRSALEQCQFESGGEQADEAAQEWGARHANERAGRCHAGWMRAHFRTS